VRLPRDVSGRELARLLARFGYQMTRETGSHIRLTTRQGGEHHVTIPDHSDLRIGTLNAILGHVANHLGVDRSEVVRQLFA
jgi:predicted RNA binding protein YcfA (HicA-like mRNA interferase family)